MEMPLGNACFFLYFIQSCWIASTHILKRRTGFCAGQLWTCIKVGNCVVTWYILAVLHILIFIHSFLFSAPQVSGRKRCLFINPPNFRSSVIWWGWLWPTAGLDASQRAIMVRAGMHSKSMDCTNIYTQLGLWTSCWFSSCSLWRCLGCGFHWEGESLHLDSSGPASAPTG